MTFKPEPNNVDFIAQEHDILKFWETSQAFEKLRQLRKGSPPWSFLDGPITANNPMGVHHGWGRTYKDLFNRFWAMQGRELRYQQGFDCQGLWVEVEVEKEKGFQSKKDIEAYGLAEFVKECKARVLKYAAVQTDQSIRLGYWMDWNRPEDLLALREKLLEDPGQTITVQGPQGPVVGTVEDIVGRLGLPELGGSYFTFSAENNYMIWAFIKKTWEKGWLYRGADVMPWCPRCATGISQHEIVTDGYAELTHRSVTLKFPLRGRANESLLVWTTTPWTLTSNVAAAVGPHLTYARVRQGEEIFYLSKGTLHMLRGDYEVLGELKGREMEGWAYDGPFDDLPAARTPGGVTHLRELIADIQTSAAQAHRVLLWEEVGEEEGTGIVHIAPGCGAEDFQLGRENGLPLIAPIDDEGYFGAQFGPFSGMHVSEVAEPVFRALEAKGRLYKVEDYTHRYPTCWRCKTELVFRLVDEWFISMGPVYDKPRRELTPEEKANSLRYQIMDVVDQIRWVPEFGHAREIDWLYNMHDWMISKKRYWGLSLPIWMCKDCGHYHVVGSEDELQERAVEGWETFQGHTPHRPYVDAVKIRCEQCGGLMERIPDVGNPWLDAGIVPFSTMQYRIDPGYWRKWYPADWVSESFPGQFRNWFYSLLAMATVIDGTPPFKELFGYGTLLAEDGRPMHKSWGNSIEFNEAADKMGVDVMRWLYCAHKPENNLLFGYGRADEVRRRFLIPLWNIYSFFTTYAHLENWQPAALEDPSRPAETAPQSGNLLDRWILARLNQTITEVSAALRETDPFRATLSAEAFVDDLSNWYLRRSRRRFWKKAEEGGEDTQAAYATLYHVLVRLTRLLAPFIPFVTETMYQNLVRGVFPEALESIHHTLWPEPDPAAVDASLLEEMALARRIASLGLSARANANIKVRQPLSRALVHAGQGRSALRQALADIVRDELNIKELEFVQDAGALVSYRVLPNNKLLGPKFGRDFPAVRAALAALPPAEVAARVAAGEPLALEVNGQTVELSSEEILVQTEAAEGLAVAADKVISVGLDTNITPELRSEGLAREVVRRIQALRKEAAFEISDRIVTWYQAEEALAEAIAAWGEYIRGETLSLELRSAAPPAEAFTAAHTIEGMELRLGVQRA